MVEPKTWSNSALVTGDQSAAGTDWLIVTMTNVKALAGLAHCYIRSGDIERAEQTLDLVGPEGQNDPDVTSARAALQLAGQTADSGEVAELRTKVGANPKDYEARFDLANALNAEGDREGAMNELLEIVRMDRNWNDEAARKQLVTFFDAWGASDELTIAGRQQLSAILFA